MESGGETDRDEGEGGDCTKPVMDGKGRCVGNKTIFFEKNVEGRKSTSGFVKKLFFANIRRG